MWSCSGFKITRQFRNINVNAARQVSTKLASSDLTLLDLDKPRSSAEEVWSAAPAYTPSFNFASYANESVVVQKLVDLGVEVWRWERLEGVPEHVLRLDFGRDVGPYLRFLVSCGLPPDRLGFFLTKNPFLFKVELADLQTRVEYLKSKKLNDVGRILGACPGWLNHSVEAIDRRLGFIQKTFKLSPNQLRSLALSAPGLISGKLSQVKNVNIKVKDEMGFEPDEIRELLVGCPRIWAIDPTRLWLRFDLLHNTHNFTHSDIVNSPTLLLTRASRLKERLGFLHFIGRAQFNPAKPNFVNAEHLVQGEDGDFAVRVAKASAAGFNEYLKSL